ncbi:MAG: AAA family ATPase [Thermoplasmata archaeon]|nr:AAA family ATPase [Thermoplasmata archaeon]
MALIEFSIENYRSIRDRVTLSLVAASDRSLDNNLIRHEALKKDRLLRTAVIYGANASGKSNVLRALHDLRHLITTSHEYQKGGKIPYNPFKLDEEWRTRPTNLEVVFIKNGIKYIYGVSFTAEKVIDEYLYYYPRGRIARIFQRKNTSDYRFTIDAKEQRFFAEKTPDNVLYLSRATQLNYEKTSAAFEWFRDDLRIIGPINPEIDITIDMLKDENSKKLILKALTEADLGIDDIIGTVQNTSVNDLIKAKKLSDRISGDTQIVINEDGSIIEIKIGTLHGKVSFDFFEEESEGTQRMFSLIGPWIDALQNGKVLVVDELDTKLHHLLNVFLIKLFHDPTQNKKGAQLIFNTHNTSLLDRNLFRRDQIWFTERDPESGKTELFSLAEFKPRKDKDLKKGYLTGRYGALPFIKEGRIF